MGRLQGIAPVNSTLSTTKWQVVAINPQSVDDDRVPGKIPDFRLNMALISGPLVVEPATADRMAAGI